MATKRNKQQEAKGRLAAEARRVVAVFEEVSEDTAASACYKIGAAVNSAKAAGVPQEEGLEIVDKILKRTGHR